MLKSRGQTGDVSERQKSVRVRTHALGASPPSRGLPHRRRTPLACVTIIIVVHLGPLSHHLISSHLADL